MYEHQIYLQHLILFHRKVILKPLLLTYFIITIEGNITIVFLQYYLDIEHIITPSNYSDYQHMYVLLS